MTKMNSTRYSKLLTCCFVAMLALSVAAPVAAVSVDTADVPTEGEVGSQYEASVTFDDLFTQNDEWQVNVTTELVNQPKWTLELIDDGEVVETKTRVGQNVTFSDASVSSPVDEITLSVEGEVPEVGNYTYANEETFTAMSVSQIPVATSGETGAPAEIESWDAHHFTAESKEARNAIDAAAAAIADAEDADADTESAAESLANAKAFYRNADFDQAISNAENAEQEAADAIDAKESSERTTQLVIYAVIALVVLGLLGGGFYWYKQNQQNTSRLG